MQQLSRITGTLAACPGCGGQPKHVERLGKGTHWLECCPCGTRTHAAATLQEAVEAWERQETHMLETVA